MGIFDKLLGGNVDSSIGGGDDMSLWNFDSSSYPGAGNDYSSFYEVPTN